MKSTFSFSSVFFLKHTERKCEFYIKYSQLYTILQLPVLLMIKHGSKIRDWMRRRRTCVTMATAATAVAAAAAAKWRLTCGRVLTSSGALWGDDPVHGATCWIDRRQSVMSDCVVVTWDCREPLRRYRSPANHSHARTTNVDVVRALNVTLLIVTE